MKAEFGFRMAEGLMVISAIGMFLLAKAGIKVLAWLMVNVVMPGAAWIRSVDWAEVANTLAELVVRFCSRVFLLAFGWWEGAIAA